jgi:hypothetical protein
VSTIASASKMNASASALVVSWRASIQVPIGTRMPDAPATPM